MSLLEAIVLGIVQGVTEFLPVSSTAHLRLVPVLCGWDDPGAAFSAVIQCGTLAAVCAAMRGDLARLAAGVLAGLRAGRPLGSAEGRLAVTVLLGTLPIVVVGYACRHAIRGEARRIEVVTAALVVTTLVMAAAECLISRRARRGNRGRHGLEAVTAGDGAAMGIAQVLALVPGTSRSGITISCGMATGLDRETAARFSFLLSLPAVAAAGVLEAWQQREAIFGSGTALLHAAVGTLTAAVVGTVTIRWLLRLLVSRSLWPFIVYRLGLAAALVWAFGASAARSIPSLFAFL